MQDIRSGGGDGATIARRRRPVDRSRAARDPGRAERGSIGSSGARSGTARGGGWISGAIYGANDGLAAVFGIVAGVSGATGGSSAVLTAGLAGAIASALSMATGAFLAERSEAEVAAANVERERQEIAEHPEEEKEELSLFYQLKGIDEKTADELAERMSQHPDAMLQALSAEEFGATAGGGNDAVEAAAAAGISTGLGAIIPVIPFMITTGTAAIVAAAVVSLIAHFLVGCREVARDAAQLVVGGARDDARRRDRRRRHLPRRPRAPDLASRRARRAAPRSSARSEATSASSASTRSASRPSALARAGSHGGRQAPRAQPAPAAGRTRVIRS